MPPAPRSARPSNGRVRLSAAPARSAIDRQARCSRRRTCRTGGCLESVCRPWPTDRGRGHRPRRTSTRRRFRPPRLPISPDVLVNAVRKCDDRSRIRHRPRAAAQRCAVNCEDVVVLPIDQVVGPPPLSCARKAGEARTVAQPARPHDHPDRDSGADDIAGHHRIRPDLAAASALAHHAAWHDRPYVHGGLDPPVRRLQRRGIRRSWSVAIVMTRSSSA